MIPSNSRSNQNQLNKQGLLLLPVPVLFAWMPAPCSCLAGQRAAAPGRLAAEWGARAGQQSAGQPATYRGARGEGRGPSRRGRAEGERRATEAEARRGRPVTGRGDERRRSAERRAARLQSKRARRCNSDGPTLTRFAHNLVVDCSAN